jgi:amphi-Trp domain-containing protein
MKLMKVETKEEVSREEAAAQLREIADALASHNDVEIEREGRRVVLHVPARVRMEVEVELEDDGGELEVELKWRRGES